VLDELVEPPTMVGLGDVDVLDTPWGSKLDAKLYMIAPDPSSASACSREASLAGFGHDFFQPSVMA